MPSSLPKIVMCALVPVLASLCACALPPALTIISLATNAVSYAATGKSVSDHGISAVVGEDCALWRVVADRKICTPDSPALAGPASDGVEEQPPKAPSVAYGGAEPTQVAAATPKAGRFLVLGAFMDQANARRFAASVDGVGSTIVAVSLYGATFYRVVAGPLDDTGVRVVRERMTLLAAVQPWEITEPRAKSDMAATSLTTPATPTARPSTAPNVITATLPSSPRNAAPIRVRD